MGTSSANKPVISLDVSFGDAPPEAMVTPLCQSLCELCRPLLRDDDATARLRLTAHELLENIVKYSGDGACAFRFELRHGEQGALTTFIETWNTPAEAHRAQVELRFAALSAATDPLEHYDSMIAHSARQPAGSGLGLARIHAETEYRLSHRFEQARLVITAAGHVLRSEAKAP